MKLRELLHKNVRIEFVDGDVLEGYVHNHTSALDNDPDPESIMIDYYEIFEEDIKEIKVIGE